MGVGFLLMGLIGSAHCVGMCGPLMLATPFKGNGKFYFNMINYHIGRTFTYVVLGLLVAMLGVGAKLFEWQQVAAVLLGTILIASGVYTTWLNGKIRVIEKYKSAVLKLTSRYLNKSTKKHFFVLGLLNGLLPCGLVYITLGLATVSGGVWSAMINMTFFGLGTIPALFFIGFVKERLSPMFRMRLVRITPILTMVVGLLLVVRGMNLGVPYLSPELEVNKEVSCCHK